MTMPKTTIKLYNTKIRRKEDFVPIDADNVRMYVCGPTVYDRAHLGNARPVIVFDILYRLLRHVYGPDHVTYVRNFTDVDDRINETAQKRKAAGAEGTLETLIADRADETIDWYHQDMDALGALRPDHAPRATGFIGQMVAMIEDLIAKGHAYAAEGHVLFAVDSYKEYGALSGRSVDDMIAGARVEVAPYKRNPMDFVLWKPSTDDLPGWPSPWGRGRPGWHIECVAMALDILGDGFDLHGGGTDLAFPHHENERSESEAAGHPFARGWIHSAMLNIGGEKMSKSLNNFKTLGDVLDMWDPRALRLAMLQTHYRKVMELGDEAMQGATAALDRLDAFQRRISVLNLDANAPLQADEVAAFTEAMDHDFGAPAAVATIFELVRAGHTAVDNGDLAEAASIAATISELSGVLGLVTTGGETGDDDSEIDDLVAQRQAARDNKDFAESDRLRDELNVRGIEVEDTAAGPIWRRVSPTNAN